MTKADALMYWLKPLHEGAEIQDLILRGLELGWLDWETARRLFDQARAFELASIPRREFWRVVNDLA